MPIWVHHLLGLSLLEEFIIMKLDNAHLGQIAAPVATPNYDRSTLTAGIIHFGVGGFHRGHQAMSRASRGCAGNPSLPVSVIPGPGPAAPLPPCASPSPPRAG